jgi:hypothetical protein
MSNYANCSDAFLKHQLDYFKSLNVSRESAAHSYHSVLGAICGLTNEIVNRRRALEAIATISILNIQASI